MRKHSQRDNSVYRIALLLLFLILMSWLAACSGGQTGTFVTGPAGPATRADADATSSTEAGPAVDNDSSTMLFPVRPGSCEYDASLQENLSTYDGTAMAPGTPFAHTWRVLNSGTCPWDPGTTMFFDSGTLTGIVNSVNVPARPPDATADVTVGFMAPDTPGEYTSFWKMRMANGEVLESVYAVRITVATDQPPATAVSDPPTATVAPAATTPPVVAPTPTPIPVAPTAEPPEEDAWFGEYFNNPSVQGQPLTTRNDSEINFNWGTGAPMPLMPSNQFSVRWTRQSSFEEGTYRFFARSDDGVRVWVNGRLIIDQWHPVRDETYQADLALMAGEHDIRVEYFEDIQLAAVQFWWERAPGSGNWRGEYFNNRELSGSPAMVREDLAVAFNWGWVHQAAISTMIVSPCAGPRRRSMRPAPIVFM